ncbi:MAG: glycogen debranching enzyme GlgX, partial [Xanthomonas perforans]|nr:glycogen debranching enzyme GlgX [Xanthomonas perforans]
GVEGDTNDPGIKQLRRQQMRNLLATLLLSQGTPMLLAGDEFGHSQNGNNNAYCQDNELTWIDWTAATKAAAADQAAFVRRLIRIRQRYPLLHRARFFDGK